MISGVQANPPSAHGEGPASSVYSDPMRAGLWESCSEPWCPEVT